MRTKLAVPLFLFLFTLIFAGTGKYKLNGTVIDLMTSKPLSHVSVSILSRNDSKVIAATATDEKGNFDLKGIDQSLVKVRLSSVGYRSQLIDSLSLDNVSHLGLIHLEPTTIEMAEVVIKSIKPMIEEHADRKILNVDRMPGSSGTVTEVLKNSGLVDVDPSTNAVSIRGESVKIKMDGHESTLTGEMLNQMPAKMLDQVEIILAPGAKESAEGGTYIINMISKKNMFDNFSGSLSLNTSTTNMNSSGIDLNYKVNKLNIFGQFYGAYYEFGSESESNRYVYNSPTMYNQYSKGNSKYYGMYGYAKFGFDYDIDEKNSITAYTTFNGMNYRNSSTSGNSVFNSKDVYQYGYDRLTSGENPENDLMFYGFYKKQFAKRGNEITFDVMYTSITGTTINDMDFGYSYMPTKPQLKNSTSKLDASTFVFKADYALPFNTDRLEAGYNFTHRTRKNDYNVEDYSYMNNAWKDSLNLSNIFDYKENIHALYLTYAYKLDKFDIKLGVRGENLNTEGNQVTQNKIFNENYLSLFPNFNVSYKISDLFQLGFNAFRRVMYPQMYYINPFRQYQGPNTFFEGNPNLEPTYSTSYSFNLSRYINVYYTKSTGNMTSALSTENDTVLVSSYINLNTNETYGFQLTFPYYNSPTMPFHLPDFVTMMNLSFNATFSKQTGRYLQQDLSMDDRTYNMNANIGLKLWWEIESQIYFMFRPAIDNKLTKRNSMNYLGIYFNRYFFDRKVRVSISLMDVLNANKYDSQSFGAGYYTISSGRSLSSQGISIGISYLFNEYKPRNERTVGDGRDSNGNSSSGGGM